MIDVKNVKYSLEISVANVGDSGGGTRYNLTDLLVSLSLEEAVGELAARASFTLRNLKTDDGYVMQLVKVNTPVFIYASWADINNPNSAKTLVFFGNVWDWNYSSDVNKQLSVTAYDPLIRLQKSKDFKYYSSGMSTEAIVSDICQTWGIPLRYQWESVTHAAKTFRTKAISDMIFSLLNEVNGKTGAKYVVRFEDGTLQIGYRGTNHDVYMFDTSNVVSTSNEINISNLVTKVKVLGNVEDEKLTPLLGIATGKTEFGTLQEILTTDGSKTLADITNEAIEIIKERGVPSETIKVTVPDLPFVHKGYKIRIAAGNLIGYFFVVGVTHNAVNRTMLLQLERPAEEVETVNVNVQTRS